MCVWLEMVENEDKNLQDSTGEETQKVDENEVLENLDPPSRDLEDKEIDNTIIENECEIDIKNINIFLLQHALLCSQLVKLNVTS